MTARFGRVAAFRSALLMTGSTYVTYLIGLIVSTLVARSLGPTDYGHYAYLVWLSSVLILIFNNGLTTSGMRFVSECLGREDHAQARGVHGWLLKRYRVSLLLGALAFAAAFPFIQPAQWSGPAWLFAAAALLAALAKSGYLFGSSIAKGHGLFNIEAHTTNLMAVASLVGTGVLAAWRQPLSAYIALFVVLSLGHTVMTYALMARAGISPSHDSLDPDVVGRMRKHLVWSIVLTLIAALSNKSIETVMLNALVGPEAVGFFSIAATMTRGGVDLLASGLSSILLPIMAHAFGAGGLSRVHRIMGDAVRYYFFLGIILAGVGYLWAAPVVTLMYGAQFAPAITALQIMLLVGGFTMTEAAFSSLLSTTDHQKLRAFIAMFWIAVVAAACTLLIPRYGFTGALAAHAVSRVVVFIVTVGGLVTMMKIPLPWRELGRMILTALGALVLPGAVLWIWPGLVSQFIAGGLFGLGCLLLSVWFRVWTTRDVSVVHAVAERIQPLRRLARWLEKHARPS